MAPRKKASKKTLAPVQPDSPWSDGGEEVIEPGIGEGFVHWEKVGNALRGVLLKRWQSRSMKSPAVTIELSEEPDVDIYETSGDEPVAVECGPGVKVNMSLTFDLDRKLTADLEGQEIGILYSGDQSTAKGAMRLFRVFVFAESGLPF